VRSFNPQHPAVKIPTRQRADRFGETPMKSSDHPIESLSLLLDHAAAETAEAANRSQADYFIRLLEENCIEIDRRITNHQTDIAGYESRGCLDDARRCRRIIRIEEPSNMSALHSVGPPPKRDDGRCR
jgi:hypothetical protein